MKKTMYSLMVAALFAAATLARANDLPYEHDGGGPDDPVPTDEATDLGGRGATQGSESGSLDELRSMIDNWVAFVSDHFNMLPNRSQIIG